jgi:hypothetical protein
MAALTLRKEPPLPIGQEVVPGKIENLISRERQNI